MFSWRKRRTEPSSRAKGPAGFAARIAERPYERGRCRMLIEEYSRWRTALAERLGPRFGDELELAHALRGCVTAECPACQVRLSAEYLEWLTSPDAATHLPAARFAAGICPNPSCTCNELILYWLPTARM